MTFIKRQNKPCQNQKRFAQRGNMKSSGNQSRWPKVTFVFALSFHQAITAVAMKRTCGMLHIQRKWTQAILRSSLRCVCLRRSIYIHDNEKDQSRPLNWKRVALLRCPSTGYLQSRNYLANLSAARWVELINSSRGRHWADTAPPPAHAAQIPVSLANSAFVSHAFLCQHSDDPFKHAGSPAFSHLCLFTHPL